MSRQRRGRRHCIYYGAEEAPTPGTTHLGFRLDPHEKRCAPIFQFNEFDRDTPSSMKMQSLKATTRQRKKVLKASPFSREAWPFWPPPRLSDARSRPCWRFPDFQAPVILDTSPRNRPGQGFTRSVHPHYHLGPNSCASQGCPALLWLPRPRVSGGCPTEGVKRMFSVPPQALQH